MEQAKAVSLKGSHKDLIQEWHALLHCRSHQGEKALNGIFNDTFHTYLQEAKSFFLTDPGTTELGWSGSWVLQQKRKLRSFSEMLLNLRECLFALELYYLSTGFQFQTKSSNFVFR